MQNAAYVFAFASGCQCRSGRSSVPSENAGHAEADRSTGNGGRLVSLASRIRLLAVGSRYQHATILRGAERASGRGRHRSYTVGEREGGYRRV